MSYQRLSIATLPLLVLATPALAHPGHGAHSGFTAGLLHPLSGLDHVLAMVAVGLFAAQIGGRALLLVPLAFVATMSFGGILGYAGVPLPMVEQGIAASVIVMGLAVASGLRLSNVGGMLLVGAFALFHGHAHGSEEAGLGSFLPYAVGFIVSTTLLHATGIALSLGLGSMANPTSQLLRRTAGIAGALAGVAMLVG